MSTYALRFVGQEGLSNRLSDFDLNQFFQLTEADIKAVGAQFRSDHRAPAALMVLYLRAVGRPLDSSTVLPRNLLRYVGETFRTTAPTIATLRSIYQRSQTLYKHQLWAKTHLGLKDLDYQSEAALVALLKLQAAEASHADDLATAACHWLYRDKIYSVTLTLAGERDHIVVHVKNRGPVIAAEFFEAIFNPLVQLANVADDSNRPVTSLGLGLHIARTIAVAHNGRISVTSTEKNGTVFTVRLPRDQRSTS